MGEDKIKLQAAKIFKDAATYIRVNGWRVSGMSEDGLPRCSMGALASSYPAMKWESQLSELMYKSLYDKLDGLTLTEFNYKYRSGERVAQLFDNVASSLTENFTVSIVN